LVAPGTYTGDGNRDIAFGGKDVVLVGTHGAEATIIDCQGTISDPHRGFRFDGGETRAAVVDGFTIRDGSVVGSDEDGGAIYCLSPVTIINCHFEENRARGGGAIACIDSSPMIDRCAFSDNSGHTGGAIEIQGGQPIIARASFTNNASQSGGAIRALGGPPGALLTLNDSVFEQNTSGGTGGAISSAFQRLLMTNCILSENTAVYQGGGVYCTSGTPATIHESLFVANSAGTTGGGVHIEDASYTLTDCIFASNVADRGGGLSGDDPSPSIHRCTFVRNSAAVGGGIYFTVAISLSLENTIISFSSNGEGFACTNLPAFLTVSCCDIYGNVGGDWIGCIVDLQGFNGNISDDPLFCDVTNQDYTLRSDSPCAPANSGDCGLIGALPVACGTTTVAPATWGAIKAAFDLR
jgi:hypothetical protein